MKHGISFEDATAIFRADIPMLVEIDDRQDYGEDRWIGIGMMGNLVAVVVFSEPRIDAIRLISARKANQHEQEFYFRTSHV